MISAGMAIVSGAGSGIGRCIAQSLKDRGWLIASLDLRNPGGFDFGRAVDVCDETAIHTAVADAEAELGPVSAVIAGAGYYEEVSLQDITTDAWMTMLHTHVGGVYNLMRATLPQMVMRNAGSFITIASERAIVGAGNDAHYGSAKAAALALTRSAALEVSGGKVRVNAVGPGPTDTPLLPADSWERQSSFTDTLPAGRIATPEEIAVAVVALAETDMFMHGGLFSINSGTVM